MSTAGNLLFVGEFPRIVGGIERYMAHSAQILRRHGFRVSALFTATAQPDLEFLQTFDQVYDAVAALPGADAFDACVVHKIRDPKLLDVLEQRWPTTIFVHDHDYYCPRRCRYRVLGKRNCVRAYRWLPCGLCALTRNSNDALTTRVWDAFVRAPRLMRRVRRAGKLAVLSHFMAANLTLGGCDPRRIVLIPPAIPLQPPATGSQPPKLFFSGQLIAGKGVDLLLQALEQVEGEWELAIVGSGNAEPALRAQAAKFGSRVVFHGWQPHPEQLRRSADIAVLPARWQEPFGLVGPEAQAQGLPLIAFDRGGVRDYLRDGENGILVPPGDTAALAQAITTLLQDPARRREYGRRGREWVAAQFTEERLVAAYQALSAGSEVSG